MTPAVVFDVNETLLDLGALDPQFESLFGDASLRSDWFALVLRNAMTLTITGDYVDFVAVGRASLEMVGAAHGIEVRPDAIEQIAAAMRALPPHADVDHNLARLGAAGFTVAALTNSPPGAATAQLSTAGIIDRFDHVLSVDAVRRFKPAREVYHSAAAALGLPIEAVTLVATHDWDVAGAMRAGARGAFVARRGMVWNPLYPEPDISAPSLDGVVDQMLAS